MNATFHVAGEHIESFLFSAEYLAMCRTVSNHQSRNWDASRFFNLSNLRLPKIRLQFERKRRAVFA